MSAKYQPVKLNRRMFLANSGKAALGLALSQQVFAMAHRVKVPPQVTDLLTIDGPGLNAGELLKNGFTSLVVDFRFSPKSYSAANESLDLWDKEFKNPKSKIHLIKAYKDLQVAHEKKKLGIILCTQYASILGPPVYSKNNSNLKNLEHFYKRGLRVINLTHNDTNGIAGGYWDKRNYGLTRLGVAVIEKMNDLGMIIDVSHCSDATTDETLQRSKKPVIFSHTGVRKLYNSPRNKSDAQIKKCADKGGVIGIYNISHWLTYEKEAKMDHIINHIDYIVNLAGIDHVAFGSDGPATQEVNMDKKLKWFQNIVIERSFPGNPTKPVHMRYRPLDSSQRMMRLKEGLAKKGYKPRDIQKVLGDNFARVYKEVCG